MNVYAVLSLFERDPASYPSYVVKYAVTPLRAGMSRIEILFNRIKSDLFAFIGRYVKDHVITLDNGIS